MTTTRMIPIAAPYVLLDDNTGLGGPSALYTNPVEVVTAHTPAEVPDALRKLETAGERGLHAVGYFAYELGYALEPRLAGLMPAIRPVPLLWFGLFRAPQLLNGSDVETWLQDQTGGQTARLRDVTHSWSEQDYAKRFERAVANILSGDIYQINLTFRARFRLEGSAVALYRELRQKQRVAYGGIIDTGDLAVLSASPELFIESYGRTISTRPMKGTSPRGADTARDEEAKLVLQTDEKQRAENLMIVDLMRNDLGRIAETGSVEVTDLFTVETFKTLHQMTSGVKAQLLPGLSLDTLLAAIFPPGSVTGAPKIRAMELVAELEDSPRGVYCGAIGRISPDGHSLFNVAIRTPVFFPDGRGEMGIGSGVVADSDGGREYAECLLKMRFLTDRVRDFDLIETMLYEPDNATQSLSAGFWLLDGHLERLARSSSHFGFVFARDRVVADLESAIRGKASRRLRVRLLLSEDGGTTITTTDLPAASGPVTMRYVVSPTRLDSADIFLRHKTTKRQLYDREWQYYHDSLGVDDVIYLNERDEVCEGSRTSVFLERDKMLLTPPVEVGALPGVLRAALIESGKARTAVLSLDDLSRGSVFLGNSVRGLVRAAAVGQEAVVPAQRAG